MIIAFEFIEQHFKVGIILQERKSMHGEVKEFTLGHTGYKLKAVI